VVKTSEAWSLFQDFITERFGLYTSPFLVSDDEEVRRNSFEALLKHLKSTNIESVVYPIKFLSDDESYDLWRGSGVVIADQLVKIMNDDAYPSRTRRFAFVALVKVSPLRALEKLSSPILSLLSEGDIKRIASAFVKLKAEPQAIAVIRDIIIGSSQEKYVRDPRSDPSFRPQASLMAAILMAMDTPASVNTLLDLWENNENVGSYIIANLDFLGEKEKERFVTRAYALTRSNIERRGLLPEMGNINGVDFLIKVYLGVNDDDTRSLVLFLLGLRREDAAWKMLYDSLSENAWVKEKQGLSLDAARALSSWGLTHFDGSTETIGRSISQREMASASLTTVLKERGPRNLIEDEQKLYGVLIAEAMRVSPNLELVHLAGEAYQMKDATEALRISAVEALTFPDPYFSGIAVSDKLHLLDPDRRVIAEAASFLIQVFESYIGKSSDRLIQFAISSLRDFYMRYTAEPPVADGIFQCLQKLYLSFLDDHDMNIVIFQALAVIWRADPRYSFALLEEKLGKVEVDALKQRMREYLNAEELVPLVKQADQAQSALGGIDMNSANMDFIIKRDGQGMPLPANQQDFAQVHIDGLIPIILSIRPMNVDLLK